MVHIHTFRENTKIVRTRGTDDHSSMISSRHDRDAVLMNSKQLAAYRRPAGPTPVNLPTAMEADFTLSGPISRSGAIGSQL